MQRQGPDFLCIGMQKAGTGWLYRAFNQIDGFRMLPIKEFLHFDRLGQTGKYQLRRRNKRISHQMASKRGGLSTQSYSRLEGAVDRYARSGYATSAYLDLFEADRDWLTGDITPSYSTLNSAAVAGVHDVLPDIPVILSIRHPVDRLWSSFNMRCRKQVEPDAGKTTDDLQGLMDEQATVGNLNTYLAEPKTMIRSMPSVIHDAWSVYGDKLMVISLDEIISHPKDLMQRLAKRIMGRDVVLADDFVVKNSKATLAKVKMTDRHRAVLFDVFRDEIRTCKERFPDIAADWKSD